MELFEEILLHHLKKNEPAFPADPQALVHDTAYQALSAIRLILELLQHLCEQLLFLC